MAFTIAQIQSSVLPTGAATEVTLAAVQALLTTISAQLPASLGQKTMAASLPVTLASNQSAIPVTGPLTDAQLRASAVPISGSVGVSGSVAVTGPLTDTQLRAAAVPISGAVTSNIGTTNGLALDNTLTGGTQKTKITDGTDDAAVMGSQIRPTQSDPALVVTLSPNSGLITNSWASLAGSAGAAAVLTLPALGPGLYYYFTHIELAKLYSTTGVAAAAGVNILTTNMGGLSWLTEQVAAPIGTVVKVVSMTPAIPIRCAAANTAVVFQTAAQAQSTWRWNVGFYVGV